MKTIRKKRKANELGHHEQLWERRFLELTKFKKEYRHCDVPNNPKKKKYLILARWCHTQRAVRKLNLWKYPHYRVKRLTELGFSWYLSDKRFESNFGQLKAYRQKHGHCDVKSKENKMLADWCATIRSAHEKKLSTLTKERIKRLNELGFPWNSPKEQENEMRWERQYAKLKEYKRKYGHCNVSKSEREIKHKPLADWVKAQRIHYQTKNKCLSADKIWKLNSIGFNWVSPLKVGAKRINDEELLADLRRLYTLRGLLPSPAFIDKHGKYAANSYISHFGGMAKARQKAGINSSIIRVRKISDTQLLDELKRLAALLLKEPSGRDVRKHGKYSSKLYEKRFGGLRQARGKAGMNPAIIRKPKIYSDAELLDDLKRLTNLLGRKPSQTDVQQHGKYSVDTYRSHFRLFSIACQMAKIE